MQSMVHSASQLHLLCLGCHAICLPLLSLLSECLFLLLGSFQQILCRFQLPMQTQLKSLACKAYRPAAKSYTSHSSRQSCTGRQHHSPC